MKVLRWPGSKWNIANRIVSMMPEHSIYIEPFFGSGAVFFNKIPCNTEILNDLDGEVVNFFKCIRDYPEELAKLIYYTPYSREEYDKSYECSGTDLERARKFVIRSNMAIGASQCYKAGWRHTGLKMGKTHYQRTVNEWNTLPENIIEAAERLKCAEIENMDAIELIQRYNDEKCLIYADPPYLLSIKKQKYYNKEMTETEVHKRLIEVLKEHKGPVILSGYHSKLYDDLLSDWDRIEIKAQAERGEIRQEVLWLNYSIPKQVSMYDIGLASNK